MFFVVERGCEIIWWQIPKEDKFKLWIKVTPVPGIELATFVTSVWQKIRSYYIGRDITTSLPLHGCTLDPWPGLQRSLFCIRTHYTPFPRECTSIRVAVHLLDLHAPATVPGYCSWLLLSKNNWSIRLPMLGSIGHISVYNYTKLC